MRGSRGLVTAAALVVVACSGPGSPSVSPFPTIANPPFGTPAAGQPIEVFAAGDIAGCDTTGDEATADLLDQLVEPGGIVLALGDLAYPDGSTENFAECYDPTWGRWRRADAPDTRQPRIPPARGRTLLRLLRGRRRPPRRGLHGMGPRILGHPEPQCELPRGRRLRQRGAPDRLRRRDHRRRSPGHAAAGACSRCGTSLAGAPGASTGPTTEPRPYGGRWPWAARTSSCPATTTTTSASSRWTAKASRRPAAWSSSWWEPAGDRCYQFGDILPTSAVHDNSTFGVLHLTLRHGGYDWEFVPATPGGFTDSGSASC